MIEDLSRVGVQVHGSFYFLLALAFLAIPLQWLLAWICAAVLHESGHIVAVLCSGNRIDRVEIGWHGAKIFTESLGKSEWICALSGPVSGLILLPLIHIFPRLCICAAFQSAFNLLPIYPLDGGRMVKGLLLFLFEEAYAEQIVRYITFIAMFALFIVLWQYINTYVAIFFVSAALVVVRKEVPINIPCKHSRKWVQ